MRYAARRHPSLRAAACAALLAIGALLVLAVPARAVTGPPTNLAAPSPTKAKPALTWDAPAAPGDGIAGYNIYRGATKANATLVTSTGFTDTGAPVNGTYTYTVKAVEVGTGLESTASSAIVVVYDTVPPPTPTNLTPAATPTNQKPVLTWTEGGTDTLAGFSHYEVWRATTLIGTTTGTTFTDNALLMSGSYSYSVKAVDLAGNVSGGATKPVVYDILPPTTPATFNPAPAQNVKPVLSWAASTDTGGAGILRYDVYRNGVLVGSSTTPSFQDGSVISEATYAYTVVAVDKAGNSANPTPQRTVEYDVTPPTAPTGLVASASPTKLKPALAWAAADDPDGSGVAAYKVYRGATLAGSANGPLFSDTALATDGTYAYRVSATDRAGNESAQSAPLDVVYDKTAPPAPINLTAASPTNEAPALTWNSGGADNLTGVDRYEIFRGTALVGSVGPGVTSFTDSALSSSGSQTYTVKAVDVAGNASAASAPRTVIFDVVAPNAPTSLTLPAAVRVKPTLSWPAVTDSGGSGIDHYRVLRGGVLIGTATTTSYTDNAVDEEGSYTYTVAVADKAGNVGPTAAAKTTIYDVTPPTAPGTPTGASPTKNKPTITWTAATDAGGSGVATYTVFRNGVSVGTTATTTFTDAALSQNGVYAYTVQAADLAGNTSTVTAAVVITYDTLAPPAPTGLTAVTPTAAKPYLSWTSGGADALSGIERFDVYRGTTLVGSVPADTVELEDTTVVAAGSYQYTVKAVDHAGNVSNASLSKAVVYDTVPPAAPANLAAASPTRLPVLTWGAVTDTAGIARYDVYRDGALAGSSATTSFTDTGVPEDGVYSYTVRAIDAAGNVGPLSAARLVTFDGSPPPAPTNLSGASPTAAKPSLNWTTGGADSSSGFKHYQVYRNGLPAATVTAAAFVDSATTVNGSYSYEVAAVDQAGNESARVGPVVIEYDSTPPPVPTGLTATSPTSGKPALSWFSGGPDNVTGLSHYNVYRGNVRVNDAPVVATSFTDAALSADGTYAYTVRAVDHAGNESAASAAKTVLYDATPPTPPDGLTVTSPTRTQPALSWSASTDGSGSGVARYDVYRDGALAGSTTGLSWNDPAVLSDDTYLYTVKAVDNAGNESLASSPRAVLVDRVAPPPPADPTGPAVTNRPSFTWSAASDAGTGGSGIAGYNAYRNGVKIGSTATTSFEDADVTLDDAYSYTFTSVDAAGNESAPSTVVAVLFDDTPPPQPLSLTGASPVVAKPQLAWQSGGPDALSGLAHYEVLRNGVVVDTTGGSPWTDSALAANGAYTYTVRAVDQAGNRSVPSSPRTIVWDTTAPARPDGISAASPTAQPTLTWAVPADAGGSGMAGYRVYRDGVQVGSPAAASYTDADPIGEGTHTYTVAAVDNAGNVSEESGPVLVQVDRTAPSAPTGLTGPSPVKRPELSWGGSSDSGVLPSGVAGYQVYRSGALAGTTAGTSFTDTALTAQGSYVYTVRAVDRAGNLSPPSDSVTVLFDNTAPPTPAQLSAPSPTTGAPSLTWLSGGTDNLSGFDHYAVYRDGSLIAEVPTGSHVDALLSAQGPHEYVVRAVDRAGNASAPTPVVTVIYDVTAPPAPTNFMVASPTRLPRLTWDAVTDDDTGASGIDHYQIYRDGTLVGLSTTTTYDDGSVPSNGSFGYAVKAVDKAGNTSLASRARIVQVDATDPPAPEDVNAITPTKTPVITWRAVTDAASGGSAIAAYRVYRDGVFIGEATGTTYTDGKVTLTGQYVYTVRAIDAAGNISPPSAGREVVLDADGPILDAISFPQKTVAGAPVTFSVKPRDVHAGLQGEASWDYGDGTAVGNSTRHVFERPGRYPITIRATDALGNVTTVGDRTIQVLAPKGGVRPKVVKLGALRAMSLKVARRARWKLRAFVTVDVDTTVQLILLRRGIMVASTSRKLPAGGVPVAVTLPKALRKPGTYHLVVRSVSANKEARRAFALRR